jgi:kinetochore protein Spc7/SPC105
MRDATTSSSASSESTRRASAITEASNAQSPQSTIQSPAAGIDAEPPSTPPEQVEEPLPESSPANQRDLHQRKFRRRSSGIPPMNFNNPEDLESSSPYSGSSPTSSDSESLAVDDDNDDDDGSDTAMSLDATGQSLGDVTGQTVASSGTLDSTSSSSRLDEALRQAVAQAGAQDTQHIELELPADKSIEIENQEIANAFKPWIQKNKRDSIAIKKLSAMQDQENVNPFSPAFKAQITALGSASVDPDEETQDMSMDMTRIMGGIVRQQKLDQQSAPEDSMSQQRTLKRRRSSTNVGHSTNAMSSGSPAKRQASRRASVRRRRSSAEDSSLGEETMDFTMAVGGIQQVQEQNGARRESIDTSLGDETMDFTMVQGGILASVRAEDIDELNANEDLSMELTATLEKTIKIQPVSAISRSPARQTRSPRKSLLSTQTPEKPSTRAAAKQPKIATPQKSPRKSPRKSTGPLAIREDENDPFKPTHELRRRETVVPATPPRLVELDLPKIATPTLTSQPPSEPSIVVAVTPPRQKESIVEELIAATPPKLAATKTPSLADSIKLLSTPRKQTSVSPVKRVAPSTPKVQATPKTAAATPKKTPKKTPTPRKRGQVGFSVEEKDETVNAAEEDGEDSLEDVERIQLQDFLNRTNIRFMDLTTTKRRHTGHPGAEGKFAPEYNEEDDSPPSLENNVAAAACTVPMLTMYQHSCHEMKNYIAGGRDDLRTLEAEVYESQPPLFREYMSAPPDERAIMDNQFKNMKTNARLQSKAGWHAWRSQLLSDLKSGLLQSAADFDVDDALLEKQEELLNATLPDLVSYSEELESRRVQLQERADELSSVDRDELEATRDRLVAADAEMEEKKCLLAELQENFAEKEAQSEALLERKTECVEEIKEAERVREEFRGWSASEVTVLKGTCHTHIQIQRNGTDIFQGKSTRLNVNMAGQSHQLRHPPTQ